MPPSRLLLLSAIFAGATMLTTIAGCGDEDSATESSDAVESTAVSQEADTAAAAITLEVKADKTHAVQPGDEIRITVDVGGFILDAASIGAESVPGSGHYHVYLGSAEGEALLVSADADAVVRVPDDVTDGTHSLRIVLRNHDHSPLETPVETTVRLIIYRL